MSFKGLFKKKDTVASANKVLSDSLANTASKMHDSLTNDSMSATSNLSQELDSATQFNLHTSASAVADTSAQDPSSPPASTTPPSNEITSLDATDTENNSFNQDMHPLQDTPTPELTTSPEAAIPLDSVTPSAPKAASALANTASSSVSEEQVSSSSSSLSTDVAPLETTASEEQSTEQLVGQPINDVKQQTDVAQDNELTAIIPAKEGTTEDDVLSTQGSASSNKSVSSNVSSDASATNNQSLADVMAYPARPGSGKIFEGIYVKKERYVELLSALRSTQEMLGEQLSTQERLLEIEEQVTTNLDHAEVFLRSSFEKIMTIESLTKRC
ncbi:hypothetical protein K9M74_02180 [Candidatus Woesearchaeota archaeon]|nr:hypothetical protein [Candidatus Woesearchaeota archaeon]